MKDSPQYRELLQAMKSGTDEALIEDLRRFIESFGDHDPDCPGFDVDGRDAELAACTCGYARRHDLLDEVRSRLARR